MKLKIALLLLSCGVMLSNSGKPQTRQQCLTDCKAKCTTSFTACKQKAKTKNAQDVCQRTYDSCQAHCEEKVCPEQPQPAK